MTPQALFWVTLHLADALPAVRITTDDDPPPPHHLPTFVNHHRRQRPPPTLSHNVLHPHFLLPLGPLQSSARLLWGIFSIRLGVYIPPFLLSSPLPHRLLLPLPLSSNNSYLNWDTPDVQAPSYPYLSMEPSL